jgi:16S rRNA (guanine(966)-N(2))-methyltransferase RsmD
MRIIAGTHRARPFQAPDDDKTTRPITDRAKETLFNKLFSLGMLSAEDEAGTATPYHAADIFSGTGSMGLEVLSRGAATCLFVDQDRRTRDILDANLKGLGLATRARVLGTSALSTVWIDALPQAVRLVFLDPPYPMVQSEEIRTQLLALLPPLLKKMEDGGIVVFRTPEEIDLPEIEGYDRLVFKVGTMKFNFYQKPLPE